MPGTGGTHVVNPSHHPPFRDFACYCVPWRVLAEVSVVVAVIVGRDECWYGRSVSAISQC